MQILRHSSLFQHILSEETMKAAMEEVIAAHGSAGADNLPVSELSAFMEKNGKRLRRKIRFGIYRPQPLKIVCIPRENNTPREIAIPSVVDRMVQQAILRVLTPKLEPIFSDNSFGYRSGKSGKDALCRCLSYANEGRSVTLHVDISDFFRNIDREILWQELKKHLNAPDVLQLIRRCCCVDQLYLGTRRKTERGIPAGSPISPLLANVYLNRLDQTLKEKGFAFVRYADDLLFLCRSQDEAEDALRYTVDFLKNKLHLWLNPRKTKLCDITKAEFLGYGFRRSGTEIRAAVGGTAKKRFLKKAYGILTENNGVSVARRFTELKTYTERWRGYYDFPMIRQNAGKKAPAPQNNNPKHPIFSRVLSHIFRKTA